MLLVYSLDSRRTVVGDLVFDNKVNIQVVLEYLWWHIARPVQKVVESQNNFRLFEHGGSTNSTEAAGY